MATNSTCFDEFNKIYHLTIQIVNNVIRKRQIFDLINFNEDCNDCLV